LGHPKLLNMVSASSLIALGWPPTTESETSFASDTYVAKTSDYDESVGRYFKQKKSSQGKLAYVVYSGNEVGVFYNWYVFFSFSETY